MLAARGEAQGLVELLGEGRCRVYARTRMGRSRVSAFRPKIRIRARESAWRLAEWARAEPAGRNTAAAVCGRGGRSNQSGICWRGGAAAKWPTPMTFVRWHGPDQQTSLLLRARLSKRVPT